jgi:hypothetical protein
VIRQWNEALVESRTSVSSTTIEPNSCTEPAT